MKKILVCKKSKMHNIKIFLIFAITIIIMISLASTQHTDRGISTIIAKEKIAQLKKQVVDYTLASKITASNYGDYAEYAIDLNDDDDITNDWKIFYNDGTYVYLIAADYIPINKIPKESGIVGMEGNNYITYWNTYAGKEGMADISNEIAEQYMITAYKSEFPNDSTSNTKVTAALLDTDIWKYFAGGIEGASAVGAPTYEMFVASWNQKGYDKLVPDGVDSLGYFIELESNIGTHKVNLAESQGYNDALYFPHTSLFHDCGGYWIASPSGDTQRVYTRSWI